jgi:hypothetical protein
MRNPYIVGDPVMGRDFYGREAIIETICERRDRAVHVIGMRRIGKTSLLRQLESQLPAIFLDFQTAIGRADLARQVQRGLRRLNRQLPWLPPPDEGKSAFELLEDADERAEAEGVSLWFLCDEAEGLIDLCEQDPEALKLLRGVIWGGRATRTALASAKNLVKLDDLCREWHTSPFLSNFPSPLYLGGLTDEAADALITQSQSESPVRAVPELHAEIRCLTHNHPYLIQWLCHRLWQPDNTLRSVTPRDLEPDEHLAARLRMDFDYLSDTERRIVHEAYAAEQVTAAQLQATLDLPGLSTFLYGLTQLGYLRQEGEVYVIGNRFLVNWLEMAPWEESSKVSDKAALAVYSGQRIFPSMPYCFKVGVTGCPKQVQLDPQQVFVGMPFRAEFEDAYEYGIRRPLEEKLGLKVWRADQEPKNIDLMCKICEGLQSSRYAVLNISGWNANVFFELGLAYGLGRETLIVKDRESQVPTDLKGIEYFEYGHSGELRKKLLEFFKECMSC